MRKHNMNQIRLTVAALWVALISLSSAETITGTIHRLTENGLILDNGTAYKRTAKSEIRAINNELGSWSSLQTGSRIQLDYDSFTRITRVLVLGSIILTQEERSLIDIEPLTNSHKKVQEFTISGRVFNNGLYSNLGPGHTIIDGFQQDSSIVTYPIPNGYNLYRCSIGCVDGKTGNGMGQFKLQIKLDDEDVLSCGPFTYRQKTEPISIDVTGRRSITFTMTYIGPKSDTDAYVYAVLAEPVFIKLPPTLPKLISPMPGETISSSAALVWRGVDLASGYLLELQCYKVANSKDEDNPRRFQSVLMHRDTSTFAFDPKSLPAGKWRWRVHALGDRGIIGEAKDWQLFSTK